MKFSKVYKDPIFHFFIFGVLVYFYISSHVQSDDNSQKIIVDQKSLMQFIQYRSKAFEPNVAKKIYEDMPLTDKEELIDAYIYEEALYREAVKFGFGSNDYVIRQRMVQKIEFLSGTTTTTIDPSDDLLKTYYQNNLELYSNTPQITFTHVFFSSRDKEGQQLKHRALETLNLLQSQNKTFSDSTQYGDRFLFGNNFIEKTYDDVSNTFNPEIAKQLFSDTFGLNSWHGPIISKYGIHLFFVRARQPSRQAPFSDVRNRVKNDYLRMMKNTKRKEITHSIIDSYSPQVVWEPALVGKYKKQ